MILKPSCYLFTTLMILLCLGKEVSAQEIEPKQEINIDDLGNVSDNFQEYFFEALKQKGIQNYDKAIEALNKCIEIDAMPVYLYYELAKNQLSLKKYDEAEVNFKKVIASDPTRKYALEGLYEVYYQLKKYPEAVIVVEKLALFDEMYKEQLASLYLITQQYEKALKSLDELEDRYGKDGYRNRLRKTILARTSKSKSVNQIDYLESKIKSQPLEEQHYLNLIYVYSNKNKVEKIKETAERLLRVKPKSHLAHLALYKIYLDKGEVSEAMNSMKRIINSTIDAASKDKVINDFMLFLNKHPSYEKDFFTIIIRYAKQEENHDVYTRIGNYYFDKGEKKLALNYYERDLLNSVSDFNALKKIVLLQLDLKRFEKASEGVKLGLELYPTQPLLYLANGIALNHLKKPEDAIETLTTGVDYIIDDVKMESDFYKQIGEAYLLLGDENKSSRYLEKSKQLKSKL